MVGCDAFLLCEFNEAIVEGKKGRSQATNVTTKSNRDLRGIERVSWKNTSWHVFCSAKANSCNCPIYKPLLAIGQRQKAVTAYFTGKQLVLFVFVCEVLKANSSNYSLSQTAVTTVWLCLQYDKGKKAVTVYLQVSSLPLQACCIEYQNLHVWGRC